MTSETLLGAEWVGTLVAARGPRLEALAASLRMGHDAYGEVLLRCLERQEPRHPESYVIGAIKKEHCTLLRKELYRAEAEALATGRLDAPIVLAASAFRVHRAALKRNSDSSLRLDPEWVARYRSRKRKWTGKNAELINAQQRARYRDNPDQREKARARAAARQARLKAARAL